MYAHTTYSIRDILDAQISPQICKQILEQIKSPLLQQSFVLTADQSYNQHRNYQTTINNNNVNYHNNPFNNYHTSSQISNPNYQINHKNNHYTNYHNLSLKQSNYAEPQYSNNGFSHIQFNFNDQNSHQYSNYNLNKFNKFDQNLILTPFHPQIQDTDRKNFKKDQDLQNLCGSIFNNSQENQNQINFYDQPYQFKRQRKKIFQKQNNNKNYNLSQSPISRLQQSNASITQNQNDNNFNYIPLFDALNTLKRIEEFQIYHFLSFVNKLTKKFSMIDLHKKSLDKKMIDVYRILSKNSKQINLETSLNNQERVFNRLKVHNFTEMFDKINKELNNENGAQSNLSKEVQEQMIKYIQFFEEIEVEIQDYVSKPGITNDLKRVHEIISQNSGFTLEEKIKKFLLSLRVNEQIILTIESLTYIWPEISKKYYSQQQFIICLCKNDIIVRKYDNNTNLLREKEKQVLKQDQQVKLKINNNYQLNNFNQKDEQNSKKYERVLKDKGFNRND